MADSSGKVCYIPECSYDDMIHYPVSSRGKRITLIACVAGDCSYVKPAIVIPRKTWDADLLLLSMISEKVEIQSLHKGFINLLP